MDFLRINCWAHTYRNISINLKCVKDTKISSEILSDISKIQSCKTVEIFNCAIELFMSKWREHSNEVDNFLDYFFEEKIQRNSGWFEALVKDMWCPTTSNSIESHNKVIKDNHTFRERWPLGRFCGRILEMVNDWSVERNPEKVNAKIFHKTPVIQITLWKEAYAWLKVIISY